MHMQVALKTLELAIDVYDMLDDQSEMISPQQFGSLIVDWTNPEKAAYK